MRSKLIFVFFALIATFAIVASFYSIITGDSLTTDTQYTVAGRLLNAGVLAFCVVALFSVLSSTRRSDRLIDRVRSQVMKDREQAEPDPPVIDYERRDD